jgi:DNA-binding LytR/AlgR family response regulator
MPEGLNGEILCVEMEDRYVRVHTPEGNDLALRRLNDAIRELEGHDGMQVHRSWWVARDAVERVEKKSRQPILVLSNGLRVPVSRGYLAAVRKAGWIG